MLRLFVQPLIQELDALKRKLKEMEEEAARVKALAVGHKTIRRRRSAVICFCF